MVSDNCDVLCQWGITTSTISANRQAEIKHKLSIFRKSNFNIILPYANGSQSNNAGGPTGDPIGDAESWLIGVCSSCHCFSVPNNIVTMGTFRIRFTLKSIAAEQTSWHGAYGCFLEIEESNLDRSVLHKDF
jgi:hypothetical protein